MNVDKERVGDIEPPRELLMNNQTGNARVSLKVVGEERSSSSSDG